MRCDIGHVLETLEHFYKDKNPYVSNLAIKSRDPYKILISTILSLRTKDEVTRAASERLFSVASTPEEMLELKDEEIEKLIYPVGFYKRKARTIKEISKILIEKYNSKVPDDIDELLNLKGVGRKTANLVVILGYDKPGICVDTHVHRITNRLGYLVSKTPDQTEMILREKLPRKYWKLINDVLVLHGQNICKPISPMCSKCPVEDCCEKIGVTRHR